jgi:sphingomyelin phosphodiesterase acid-like 3
MGVCGWVKRIRGAYVAGRCVGPSALDLRDAPNLGLRPRLVCVGPSALLVMGALLASSLCVDVALVAQTPAQRTVAPATKAMVQALFLSDIHLDPFHDPGKVVELNGAGAGKWPGILARPDSATQAKDYAALQAVCPVRGLDTSYALWESSLKAMKREAAHVKFATVSGDLMAHSFDCKYKTLVPMGTHADYLAFVEKTMRTVVSGLREAVPGVPVYVGLGNNDSGCGDYALDVSGDEFLAEVAPIVDEALGPEGRAKEGARAAILNDFKAGGYYSAALPAAVPNTRILVLDDIYSSNKYKTCAKMPNLDAATAQLDWLRAQLDAARAKGEKVWVMGHIPPGVDLYTTAKNGPNLCALGTADMFLGSEKLAEVLAAYPDTVRLALFGHTHSDEMRLLLPEASGTGVSPGVPLKVTASITAVNGNNPTFTVAKIDPATATLVDYTVVMASNQTGIETTWAPEYTYSAAYGEADFSASSLADLIGKFRADASGGGPESQIYLRSYFPGDRGTHAMVLQFVWPMYACAMDHDSAKAFAACVCAKATTPSPTPATP